MRWIALALSAASLLGAACTPAEACEDVADDTASALVVWSWAYGGESVAEPRPPLTPQQDAAIDVLAGAQERFEGAGCREEEVTASMRERGNTVDEWVWGGGGEWGRQMLANGADGVREIDSSFGTHDHPPSSEAP